LPRKNDTEKLVQAFARLMVDFDLNVRSELDFKSYFDTLCSLIKLDLEPGRTNTQE